MGSSCGAALRRGRTDAPLVAGARPADGGRAVWPGRAGWGNPLCMARNKQGPEFEIEVGGEGYVWRLQRLPRWSSDTASWRGMAIAVRNADGKREAVLEFPPGPRPRFGAPQLKASQIPAALVAKAIASAIAAGWEPHSRGKVVTIVVNEGGG